MGEINGESLTIHITQVHANLGSDLKHLGIPIVKSVVEPVDSVSHYAAVAGVIGLAGIKSRKSAQNVSAGLTHAAQRLVEGMDGGLQTLEQVNSHELCDRIRAMQLTAKVVAEPLLVVGLVDSSHILTHVG